uniref:UBC core domain-containing protein n=1 Tax=Chromera velia CCMP2878 TaxID=1169474 RepID=A0A0G4HZ54_9ALVE|eukprot:Cvel_9620.t1-p1 / transcript=Cvel_9620.t1 / gene=Cvel_9620 / organism=Chromera_velia_CCMP2878 / gene_product=Ubiquitin-conjugating enzyme E2 B, putative / transcript_product=Ubiquitin-conjugating enzyme E2 B, putative / location=Cvel_scaffold559:48239-50295(-) / protein_length=603 / sequence_SO=supercontig / SO=protein_coding / is_pseudo=false
MSVQKRLTNEFKNYSANPIMNTGAKPSDKDLTLWYCVIRGELPRGSEARTLDMPLLVEFGPEYPVKAPKVGFPVHFQYTGGAQYTITDEGPLKNSMAVCLDLLGNFAHVHTEWAGTKGSGWSPAYNISTLLVNLQSVIHDTLSSMPPDESNRLSRACSEYIRKAGSDFPEVNLATASSCSSTNSGQRSDEEEKCPFDFKRAGQPPVSECVKRRCRKVFASLEENSDAQGQFVAIVNEFILGIPAGAEGELKSEEGAEEKKEEKVDPSIYCWFSSSTYKDDILGYGIRITSFRNKPELMTDGNLISLGAFEGGLRQFPDKETFHAFLPAWINKDHAEKNENWKACLKKSVANIGSKTGFSPSTGSATLCLSIFPELINTMVVRMMGAADDVRASERIFQCVLSLWRCFFYAKATLGSMREKVTKDVRDFTQNPSVRRKTVTPNVGLMLAKALILNDQEVAWGEFLRALEEETAVRRVLWWQKDGLKVTDPRQTYTAAGISRRNLLFQAVFRHFVLGADVEKILSEIEETNGLMPLRLDSLLREWKAVMEREKTGDWVTYFEDLVRCGLPVKAQREVSRDVGRWLRGCVDEANHLEGYNWVHRRR